MLIGICGRKSSGKSTVTDYLENLGFKKISFAAKLKEYVSVIYNVPVEYFYDTYKKEMVLDIPLVWNIQHTIHLSNICNETIPHYSDYVFNTYREALQIIGTDILRKFDINFHIKKLVENLNSEDNYCFDDCRFSNEKIFLENYGAHFIFIMRPNNMEYSNHISEVELNWSIFDNVILNNKSKSTLLSRIYSYINYGISAYKPPVDRDTLVHLLQKYNYNTTLVSNCINRSRDSVVWWTKNYLIDLHKGHCKYIYDDTKFIVANKESSYYAGLISADGCVKLSGKSKSCYVVELYSNDKILIEGFKGFLNSDKPIYEKIDKTNGNINYQFACNSQYIIENLKLWNIKPRKSCNNMIPDIIRYDDKLLNYWLLGLIDGDGSIFYIKQSNNIGISCAASEDVIDFLLDKYKHIGLKKYTEKNIPGLYKFSVTGIKAVKLYHEIYDGTIGLSRKWDKFAEYLSR